MSMSLLNASPVNVTIHYFSGGEEGFREGYLVDIVLWLSFVFRAYFSISRCVRPWWRRGWAGLMSLPLVARRRQGPSLYPCLASHRGPISFYFCLIIRLITILSFISMIVTFLVQGKQRRTGKFMSEAFSLLLRIFSWSFSSAFISQIGVFRHNFSTQARYFPGNKSTFLPPISWQRRLCWADMYYSLLGLLITNMFIFETHSKNYTDNRFPLSLRRTPHVTFKFVVASLQLVTRPV